MRQKLKQGIKTIVNPHDLRTLFTGVFLLLIILVGYAMLPDSYEWAVPVDNSGSFQGLTQDILKGQQVKIEMWDFAYNGNITFYVAYVMGSKEIREAVSFQTFAQGDYIRFAFTADQAYYYIYCVIFYYVSFSVNSLVSYRVTFIGLPPQVFPSIAGLLVIPLFFIIMINARKVKCLDHKGVKWRKAKGKKNAFFGVLSHEFSSFNYVLFYVILLVVLSLHAPLNSMHLRNLDFTSGDTGLSLVDKLIMFLSYFTTGGIYDYPIVMSFAMIGLFLSQIQVKQKEMDLHERALIPLTWSNMLAKVFALWISLMTPTLMFLSLLFVLLHIILYVVLEGVFVMIAFSVVMLLLLSYSAWYYSLEIWVPVKLKLLLPVVLFFVFFGDPVFRSYRGLILEVLFSSSESVGLLVLHFFGFGVGSLLCLFLSVALFKGITSNVRRIQGFM